MTRAQLSSRLGSCDDGSQMIIERDTFAAMAVFLASPGARNITGQNYNVDGGIIPE